MGTRAKLAHGGSPGGDCAHRRVIGSEYILHKLPPNSIMPTVTTVTERTCEHGTRSVYLGDQHHGLTHYSCGCVDNWVYGHITTQVVVCPMNECASCSEGCLKCVYGSQC
jgi:hypothetical protein